MSNEELSPTVIMAQKSVVQNKQATSIRKVTIESISPVIEKVQEHISFLIEETSNLRKQNQELIKAQANQKVLQNQIININLSLNKLSSTIDGFNRQKDKKLKLHEESFQKMDEQILEIREQNIILENRVEEISKNNETYLTQIEQNKQDQHEAIQQLRNNIQKYYQQELMKINFVTETMEELKVKIGFIEEKRYSDQQEIKNISNIINLYQFQRDQIKKVIEKTSFLENNVVMITDYEKYIKFNKIQLELVKTDVRSMIDQALTPEIRRFLPLLIKKLDDLNEFQNKLKKINDELNALRKQKITTEEQIIQKINQLNRLQNQSIKEVKILIKQQTQKLLQHGNDNQQKIVNKLKQLDQTLQFNKKISEVNLRQQVNKLEKDIKVYLVDWGDKLIQQKKTDIYETILNLKPPEDTQKQKLAFELIFAMQPLIKQVRQKLQFFSKNFQQSKLSLFQQLNIFSNQIVKIKSDINIQSIENKKNNDNFNNKFKNNQNFQKQISLLVSKLIESTIITYALSADPYFLQKQHQVYVTYNDGILVQIQQNGNLKYRRKQFHAQLLKRAVLSEIVTLIDKTVNQQPLIGWNQTQMRPSHFFSSIQNTYLCLYQQNTQAIQRFKKRSGSNEKRLSTRQPGSFQFNQTKMSNRNKIFSNKEVLSKTIDLQSNQFKTLIQTPRYQMQQNPVLQRNHNSNRKNIRLKKIDKKDG